jgi:hypothetical protein
MPLNAGQVELLHKQEKAAAAAAARAPPPTRSTAMRPGNAMNATSTATASNSTSGSSHRHHHKHATSANNTEDEKDYDTDDGTVPTISEWTFNTSDDTYNVEKANSTSLLPPEPEQPEQWPYILTGVFLSAALVLCALTGIRNWQNYRKRQQYQEVETLIV